MNENSEVINKLYEVILSRKGESAEKSYTAKLFGEGRNKIAKKFGEEATETIIAALAETPEKLVLESADLIYHLLVLLADKGVTPNQVFNELANRFSISGIEEKNNRKE